MPEWALSPYAVMRPRIEAERQQQLIALMLYSNGREMPETQRGKFSQQLDEAASGERAKPAKPSPEQLRGVLGSVRIEDAKGNPIELAPERG